MTRDLGRCLSFSSIQLSSKPVYFQEIYQSCCFAVFWGKIHIQTHATTHEHTYIHCAHHRHLKQWVHKVTPAFRSTHVSGNNITSCISTGTYYFILLDSLGVFHGCQLQLRSFRHFSSPPASKTTERTL